MKLPYKVMSTAALAAAMSIIPSAITHAAAGDFYDANTLKHYTKTDLVAKPDLVNQLSDALKNGDVILKELNKGIFIDYAKTQSAFDEAFAAKPDDVVAAIITAKTQGTVTAPDVTKYTDANTTTGVTVSSVSAINATTVVATLADGADATKAADKAQYTVKVGDKAVTVTSVNYDATSKKATLTVDLSNSAGTVTVNGVASSKDVDYVAPTISEVKAQSATVVDVKFSEKVDATEAENVANYKLRYALGKASETTFAATAGAGNVQATAKLLTDGQTVRITIVSVGSTVTFPGLQNGGLLKDAPYQIQVINDKIVDLAGNKAASGYGVMFYGTNIADSQAAQVLSAKYDASNGKVTLSFDKAIQTATATKIKLVADGKTAVDLSAVSATPSGNDVVIDASTLADKVTALGSTFSVQYADGAFVDVNGNNIAPATTPVTVSQGLAVTGASYNEVTNVLSLTFNKAVNVAKIPDSLSGIKVAGVSIGAGTTLKTTTNGTTVDIQLAETVADATKSADRATAVDGAAETAYAAKIADSTKDGVIVTVPDTLFEDVDGNKLTTVGAAGSTIKNATYVADTLAPVVTSVSVLDLGAAKGTLTIKFNEKVDSKVANIVTTGIKFYDAADMTKPLGDGSLTGLATLVGVDKDGKDIATSADQVFTDTWKIDLSTITDTKLAAALNTAVTATPKKSVVMTVDKDALVSMNGVKAADKTAAVPVTLFDATANYTADTFAATTSAAKSVEITVKDSTNSNADVALDKTIAENVANYIVVPTNGGAAIKVNSAVYANNKITLYLDTAATQGKSYTITATGLKTQGGVVVQDKTTKDGKFTATFTGAAAGETNATLTPVTTDVNANGKFDAGDTITLDFGTPIHLADGAKASDFTVEFGAASAGTYTLGSSTLKVDGSKLIITLASDANIAKGNTIALEKANSKLLNSDDQVAYAATPASIVGAVVDAPKIATATYSDANADGKLDKDDTITVTFTGKVAYASGKSASDIVDDFVVGVASGKTAPTYTAKLSDDGMSATLTLTDPKDFVPGASTSTINVAGTGVDLVGNWSTTLAKETDATKVVKIANADTTQPTVQNAQYVVKDDGTKTIVLQMSEKVNAATAAKFADTFTVVDSTATIAAADLVTVDLTDATKVIITLSDAADFVAPGTSTIKVAPVTTANISDASGNKILFTNSNIAIGK